MIMEGNIKRCIICEKYHEIQPCERSGTNLYRCEKFPCQIDDSVLVSDNHVETERRLNTIYNYIVNVSKLQLNYGYWRFFYEEVDAPPSNEGNINVYHLMKNYPKDIVDRIDSILLNLSKMHPSIGEVFDLDFAEEERRRLMYCELDVSHDELVSIQKILMNKKYIEGKPHFNERVINNRLILSYSAWERISELKKKQLTTNNIFIAMSFAPDAHYIELAFREAIIKAGYLPQVIKDKEHNNYIIPEIFYEIEKSKAVVVDVTKANYGAYYEAGYAQALGKEVIVCCKKEVFDDPNIKPHFDIAQKSTVVWEDEADLIVRLAKRIQATVDSQDKQ